MDSNRTSPLPPAFCPSTPATMIQMRCKSYGLVRSWCYICRIIFNYNIVTLIKHRSHSVILSITRVLDESNISSWDVFLSVCLGTARYNFVLSSWCTLCWNPNYTYLCGIQLQKHIVLIIIVKAVCAYWNMPAFLLYVKWVTEHVSQLRSQVFLRLFP
jgi:hypothetical protein